MPDKLPDDTQSESQRPHAVGFDKAYARPDPAYGMRPSPWLDELLAEDFKPGKALDLGAGAGRNSLALAQAGCEVRAIDESAAGIDRLKQAATEAGIDHLIDAQVRDIRESTWAGDRYRVIVAATILDHLPNRPAEELPRIWDRICSALDDGGLLYVEVHTTEDPGSPVGRGAHSSAPVSETAEHVHRYFRPNELLRMCRDRLRVLRYREQCEWDRTHGHPHRHGKAYLVAKKQ